MASEYTNRLACPLNDTEQTEWTAEQSVEDGHCYYCQKRATLRIEPFSQKLACKPCWEQIVYGDD